MDKGGYCSLGDILFLCFYLLIFQMAMQAYCAYVIPTSCRSVRMTSRPLIEARIRQPCLLKVTVPGIALARKLACDLSLGWAGSDCRKPPAPPATAASAEASIPKG